MSSKGPAGLLPLQAILVKLAAVIMNQEQLQGRRPLAQPSNKSISDLGQRFAAIDLLR